MRFYRQDTTANQNTLPSIITAINLPPNLTKDQQASINLILTTKDRIVGIQGVAGSGKTTMLRSLNKLCLSLKIEIIGLTVTTSAKERLQLGSQNLTSDNQLLKLGIKTLTVRKFLIESSQLLNSDPNLAKLEYGTNKLIILDESSFVSTSEMVAVIHKVEQLDARLVVMGDHKQLSSVEAGNIFYLMLGSKMKSVAMTQNVRFTSKQTLKVMQHLYQHEISEALKTLTDSLVEIPNHQERINTMAKLYLAKSKKERLQTILITPEHADRKLVNHAIREGLKNLEELTGVELNCHNLTQVKLTKAETQKIFYFKEQDLVTFFKVPVGLKVKPHEYYRIINKDLDLQTLTLAHSVTQELIDWLPAKQLATVNVYSQETRSLMQGDRIRWFKNHQQLGICNGETATIIAIEPNYQVTMDFNNGKQITLNLQELINQHWDFAYAVTTFVAQGADQKFTIALAKGGYSREVLTTEIQVGAVLECKSQVTPTKYNVNSKLVKVLEIKANSLATVEDRDGNKFELDLKKSPNDKYCHKQAIWYSYPNPVNRKQSAIPKLTSINEFLVTVTRGDQVTLLVDHIESYQHALQQKLAKYSSALEYLAPNREACKAKVAAMTQNITGVMVNEAIKQPPTTIIKNSLYPKSPMATIEQVINKLHSNILLHTTNWLGRPKKVTSIDARWGNKGSLVVKLTGNKIGYWHNFENKQGGKNLLSLYIEHFNVDFKTAIKELSNNLMLAPEQKLFAKTSINPKSPNKNQQVILDPKKLAKIHKIYQTGVPISGTLANTYLREFRKITIELPADFRFCPKLQHPDLNRLVPALIAPIKNAHNQLQGIVRIFLNKDGNKLNATYLDENHKTQLATPKANLGSMLNAAVIINHGNNTNTMYIAEGIETALSIAQAKPYDRVVASLSVTNLKNVPLALNTQKVILCADYDGFNSQSQKALQAAVDFYGTRGLEVKVAYPEKIPGMQKFDFNDVLKYLGTNSIVKSLNNAEIKLPAITQTLKASQQQISNTANFNKELSR